MNLPHIYLASRSPRRRQILEMVGIKFTLLDVEVDEDNHFVDNPREYVITLSEKKARAASTKIAKGIVATADTIVYLGGQVLNKPKDAEDAERMLNLLSGRTHQVFTGFTLLQTPGYKMVQQCEVTDVTFRKLESDEIDEYVRSGAPFDKAGAYGIQDDLSALFVEKINGDFYNVVGLPLPKFYLALKNFTNAEKTPQ
ncbi:MAG TPA: Maf family protein [Candidatus Acidoferrales bacterium]|nr:Maf family protein [Candidatus Acidoferrales bacterium]